MLLVKWQEAHPTCKNPLVAPKFSIYFPFGVGILADPALPGVRLEKWAGIN